jgi:hypothetical protein
MTDPTPDFRAELERLVELYEELGGNWSPHGYTGLWNDALAGARAALATPPGPPTPCITFCAPPLEEVIRIDKEGFHYKGQFIVDAGEAHRLMMAFLKQNTKTKPESPTDDEINALWNCCGDHDEGGGHYGNIFQFARAVIDRWGK